MQMTVNQAKCKSNKQGRIAVGMGLLIAQFIMPWLSSNNGIVNGFFGSL
jgi:hypothetical protein